MQATKDERAKAELIRREQFKELLAQTECNSYIEPLVTSSVDLIYISTIIESLKDATLLTLERLKIITSFSPDKIAIFNDILSKTQSLLSETNLEVILSYPQLRELNEALKKLFKNNLLRGETAQGHLNCILSQDHNANAAAAARAPRPTISAIVNALNLGAISTVEIQALLELPHAQKICAILLKIAEKETAIKAQSYFQYLRSETPETIEVLALIMKHYQFLGRGGFTPRGMYDATVFPDFQYAFRVFLNLAKNPTLSPQIKQILRSEEPFEYLTPSQKSHLIQFATQLLLTPNIPPEMLIIHALEQDSFHNNIITYLDVPELTTLPADYAKTKCIQVAKGGMGFATTQGQRDYQEDASTWHTFKLNELQSKETGKPLTPIQIAQRLWTAYRVLDVPTLGRAGTTASTTIYDGQGNLITATIGDAAAFAAIYDRQGNILRVVRLNDTTHNPDRGNELDRIQKAGGSVSPATDTDITRVMHPMGRAHGGLALSRSIGDWPYKRSGVCSESNVTITNIDTLLTKYNLRKEDIGTIQIITTSDGFTDGAAPPTNIKTAEEIEKERQATDIKLKERDENYLYSLLSLAKTPGLKGHEAVLAKYLCEKAEEDGSMDNISVAIKTLSFEMPKSQEKSAPVAAAAEEAKESSLEEEAGLVGVYDGHNGNGASIYVAQNIIKEVKTLFNLPEELYQTHTFSAYQNLDNYKRDGNPMPELQAVQQEAAAASSDSTSLILNKLKSGPLVKTEGAPAAQTSKPPSIDNAMNHPAALQDDLAISHDSADASANLSPTP